MFDYTPNEKTKPFEYSKLTLEDVEDWGQITILDLILNLEEYVD